MMIARACGPVGTCAEYLHETHDHLLQLGINDRGLARMDKLVRERLAAKRNSDMHGVNADYRHQDKLVTPRDAISLQRCAAQMVRSRTGRSTCAGCTFVNWREAYLQRADARSRRRSRFRHPASLRAGVLFPAGQFLARQ